MQQYENLKTSLQNASTLLFLLCVLAIRAIHSDEDGKSITFRNVSITFHSCNFCSCLCFILQSCRWISLQRRTHLLHHRWRPLQVHGGLGIIFRVTSAHHFPSYEDIAIQRNLSMCGQRIRHRLKKRKFDFCLQRLLSFANILHVSTVQRLHSLKSGKEFGI